MEQTHNTETEKSQDSGNREHLKEFVEPDQKTGTTPQSRNQRIALWFKRIGVLGFLFFLGKGLVWIAIFYGGFRFSGCDN